MDALVVKRISNLTDEELLNFWDKVRLGSCWEWTGATVRGYGSVGLRGTSYTSHRVSYSLFYSDPLNRCVCHTCDNPLCVNPEHLWLGTSIDNTSDRQSKQRQTKGEDISTSKLTEQQAIDILGSDRCDREIAEQYGISPSSVAALRRGKSWKHLTGNRRDTKSAFANSQTGVRGVSPVGKKFQATIRGRYLGTFNTIEEAKCFRDNWEVNHE